MTIQADCNASYCNVRGSY